MALPIFLIPNTMIGKTRLPNLSIPSQFSFGPKRESTFDELNRFLERTQLE